MARTFLRTFVVLSFYFQPLYTVCVAATSVMNPVYEYD